jgi:hypothetical protein
LVAVGHPRLSKDTGGIFEAMTHKVYVTGYRSLEEHEIVWPKRPFERVEDTGVGHSLDPNWWPISERSEAEAECAKLRGFGIHIGTHFCDFAVESLDNGTFAILCLSHPVELALAGAAKDQTADLDKRPYGVQCWSCQRPVLVGYVFLKEDAQINDLREKVTEIGGCVDCKTLLDNGYVCGAANHITSDVLVFADDAVPLYDAGVINPTLI